MTTDICVYLAGYVAKVKTAVGEKVQVESSNSGFYQNAFGGTAYVSFYPKEVDLTLDLSGAEGSYELTADLTDQEGKEIFGDIFKFNGNEEYMKVKLDETFNDLVKLISDHL